MLHPSPHRQCGPWPGTTESQTRPVSWPSCCTFGSVCANPSRPQSRCPKAATKNQRGFGPSQVRCHGAKTAKWYGTWKIHESHIPEEMSLLQKLRSPRHQNRRIGLELLHRPLNSPGQNSESLSSLWYQETASLFSSENAPNIPWFQMGHGFFHKRSAPPADSCAVDFDLDYKPVGITPNIFVGVSLRFGGQLAVFSRHFPPQDCL